VNGTLAPGNSPGVLTFSNDLTLGGGSTTAIQIAGDDTGRGTTFDGINVVGGLAYAGTLALSFDAPLSAGTYDLVGGGFTSQTGDFSTVSIGGTFVQSFTLPVFTAGNGWTSAVTDQSSTTWNFSFNNGSGDLTISAVPEPAAYAVLLGGLTLAWSAFRRRRSARA
jgi:trimeric autotransporter adhesin